MFNILRRFLLLFFTEIFYNFYWFLLHFSKTSFFFTDFFSFFLLLDFWICIFTHKSPFSLIEFSLSFFFLSFTVQLTTFKQIFHLLSKCGLKHLFSFATSIFHYWGWSELKGEWKKKKKKSESMNEFVFFCDHINIESSDYGSDIS